MIIFPSLSPDAKEIWIISSHCLSPPVALEHLPQFKKKLTEGYGLRYYVPTSFVTLNRWEEKRDLSVITLHIPLREKLQNTLLLFKNSECFQERELMPYLKKKKVETKHVSREKSQRHRQRTSCSGVCGINLLRRRGSAGEFVYIYLFVLSYLALKISSSQ